MFKPTNLEQKIFVDKHSFADVTIQEIDIEIGILQESSKELKESLVSTRKLVDSYTKYRDDVPSYKRDQLAATEQFEIDAKEMRKSNQGLIQTIQSSMTRISEKYGTYAYSFIRDYLEEQLGRMDRRTNEINRSIETYQRDRNSMEHSDEDELRDTLQNLIALNKKLASDYEVSIAQNKLHIEELKELKSTIRDGKLFGGPKIQKVYRKRQQQLA